MYALRGGEGENCRTEVSKMARYRRTTPSCLDRRIETNRKIERSGNENIDTPCVSPPQNRARNIANIVKERRIILPSMRQLHPMLGVLLLLGKRSWPPTYAKFRASQRGKSGFLGAPMRSKHQT